MPGDRTYGASPPRILYLVTNEVSSGLVRGQLDFVARHGFDVHAAAGTDHGGFPTGFDASATVHSLPYTREPSPLRDLVALVQTIGLIRRLRPTVVNASTPKASLLGMLAARLCRVPVRVFVIRGLRFETMTGARRRLFRVLDRLAAGCATEVLANSQSVLDVAVREGVVGHGSVLGSGSGNGIDLARFPEPGDPSAVRTSLGLSTEAPVIGFVGRMTKDKGVGDLLWAFDVVLERCPDAQLLLVGPLEHGDALSEQTQRRITEDHRIVHVGRMDEPVLAYASIDVLAFPSYREGLPNVPIEAQVCGVPVVAYASTGTVDAVADGIGGRLVPTGDRGRLAATLVEMLGNEALRVELGRSGRDWVTTRFDQQVLWSILVDRYEHWCGLSARRRETVVA